MKYTVGFVFSKNLKFVYLIRKNRPAWQQDLLNGIGGKVEADESFLECMIREAKEESGYEGAWTLFAELLYPDDVVQYFYSVANYGVVPVTIGAENIVIVCMENINLMHCVPNVRWLVPAAVVHMTDNYKFMLTGKQQAGGECALCSSDLSKFKETALRR